MSGFAIACWGFVAMLALITLRMPIALSMLVVGAAGYAWLSSPSALFYYLQTNSYHQFASYTLSVIPLFIMMGALAERSGMAATLFKAAERRAAGFRGGLPMAVILACTAFGAICGSSVATTATFGRAALPEMRRAKVDAGFATGTIAAGGSLGILIPPSVILVVYAITAEQNIAKLFQAALVPGLLAAVFYCIAIAIVVHRRPELAPPVVSNEVFAPTLPAAWTAPAGAAVIVAALVLYFLGWATIAGAILMALIGLLLIFADPEILPAAGIAITVVGGIYGGIFTPTEGAAVGVVIMLIQGLLQRRLGRVKIVEALRQTAETTAMIFLVLLGAEVFGAFLALSQMPTTLAQMIAGSGLSAWLILSLMLLSYIVLGAIMDELAMILLTLPIFIPIVLSLDFGMGAEDVAIWFGMLILVVVAIGLTAPPIGLNVFVINKIASDVPLTQTYRGVLPFIAADIVRLVVVTAFPVLSFWLVHALN
ncbi:TRAP transporter large permease [Allomesorhizobium alhagi]|jgi:TRAP-type C4-dicarboxylate transport system permease large subunit|uniref:TRAP C4-dicarboxylate transport system permease DctM subunit,DedA falily n=1 Tax=Mesorhizobium alhagi CCNWXJ12-2 TaxID=1107882 RepID=H0HU76_9HYPH|nr:TRAP transporter large permease [Mesorhizobium alhagi]EHK55712.1 TRAP C4-dicarboxylate transport system permease DctM subunit,DedA falily [Mesorhizobium alhagi CCNWXJ12-2]